MPRSVDSKTQSQIDDLFELYDTNRNGTVDCNELGTLIRALGLSPSNAQIRDLMKKYDKDTTRTLTKDEFVTLYCDESLPDPNVEADLQRAFKAFDVDGSNKVSRKELEDALVTMGEPMSKDEVTYMFNVVEMGDKEALTFDEFQLVMVGKLLQSNASADKEDAGEAHEEEKKKEGETEAEEKNEEEQDKKEEEAQEEKKEEAQEEKKEEETAPAPAAAPKSSKLPIWDELKTRLPGLEKGSEEQKKERMAMFNKFDPNGNGYLSLAEVDAGTRQELGLDQLTDDLAPILMRAFTAAKDVRAAKGRTKAQADDYVERAEFRLLMVYIYQYFELWFMFDEIDSGDDRRVNKEEFAAALPKIESWGVDVNDADAQFKAIDTNDGGIILFKEFADWALKRKLDADGGDADDSEDERDMEH